MKTSDVVFPAGRAKKKAKSRRRGSRQRVTKVTISEPEPGLSEEPEDTSLDREETRKRRFALLFHITVIVSIGLLSILLISLRFSSVMPTEEEEEAPSIKEFHSSTHVLPVGQTARYTCHAGGTPEPTVEWLHNGRPLERDGTDDQSEAWVERGFLFIRGGRYGVNTVCCMASNSAGTANHSAELLVFDACELTLDPNTAHRRLSLSEDNRKVKWVGEDQSYPDHPERFDYFLQVLGREALTGRCYWEVDWEGRVLEIGVTYRGITRRGGGDDSRFGRNNKSWSLHCTDGGYSAWYKGWGTILSLSPANSTRVGVYLDRPAGSLSFYRVSPGGGGSSDTLTHLHTFWSSFTQEDLLPGVGLWGGVWWGVEGSASVVPKGWPHLRKKKNGCGEPHTHTHTHTLD
uniref:B30.2/SPRY domain-containing protein n=1 Tax=Gadus morhua TaxID=8049 RepID=A0A8C5AY46_GADMO